MSAQIMTSTTAVSAAKTLSGTRLQSAFAVMFGLFMVGMVGFSNIDVVHNAAHDVRHSNAFPCH